MPKYNLDGHLQSIWPMDLQRGNVLRMVQADELREDRAVIATTAMPAFSDLIVVDVFYRDMHGNRVEDCDRTKQDVHRCVKLARPYCFVSGANTCCPTVLQGMEELEMTEKNLQSGFKLVVQASGRPANYIT